MILYGQRGAAVTCLRAQFSSAASLSSSRPALNRPRPMTRAREADAEATVPASALACWAAAVTRAPPASESATSGRALVAGAAGTAVAAGRPAPAGPGTPSSSRTSARSKSTRRESTRPASCGVSRLEPPVDAPEASCDSSKPAASPTDPALRIKASCVSLPRSLRTVAEETPASVSASRRTCSEKSIAPSSSNCLARAPVSSRDAKPHPSACTNQSRLGGRSRPRSSARDRPSGRSTPCSNCARSAASAASPAPASRYSAVSYSSRSHVVGINAAASSATALLAAASNAEASASRRARPAAARPDSSGAWDVKPSATTVRSRRQ
eukprot:scaffold4531_cov89-Isochrysis_galbana.AAC.1